MERSEAEELELGPAMALADRGNEALPPLETAVTEADERRLRHELRRQIARMEAELSRSFGAAFPRKGIAWQVAAPGGPRVLGVAELEQVRDAMAARLAAVRAQVADLGEQEQAYRELIDEMVADPASHKWLRVEAEAIGDPSCRSWQSKPRWGLLGMLLGWWRIRLSSGCPLAQGPWPPPDGKEEASQEAGERPAARRAVTRRG